MQFVLLSNELYDRHFSLELFFSFLSLIQSHGQEFFFSFQFCFVRQDISSEEKLEEKSSQDCPHHRTYDYGPSIHHEAEIVYVNTIDNIISQSPSRIGPQRHLDKHTDCNEDQRHSKPNLNFHFDKSGIGRDEDQNDDNVEKCSNYLSAENNGCRIDISIILYWLGKLIRDCPSEE